ncbi:hypothetical protein ACFSVM_04305 [Paenibacillus shunpengii]|uniref:Tubby C-terminal domain-containing protein n=1 Tax=Paenibacillus shunpengii TaxID=2054424 RepID=A0ABW5SM02_9BACL|nr:hypothetical protein [Paenibacillus sp. PDC88]SDW33934.1 hypothetical protein SAMN05518848_1011060 [Paenibacillus sp. PDC88]
MERKYSYKIPFMTHSKAPSILQNEVNQDLGSLRRVYRNKGLDAANWFINSLEISVDGEDLQTGFRVSIQDKMIWLGRNKWSICYIGPDGDEENILQDRTKIKLSPRFIFTYKNEEFTYTKELLDKTSFVHNSGKMLVAEIESGGSNHPMLTRQIKIHNDELPPMLLACVDRVVRLLYR